MRVVVVGTRGSALALAQTRFVVERLKETWPETEFKIRTIKTRGDQGASPREEAIFVKEIQEALLSREIDIAVHSLKDLPTESPRGLKIASVPRRQDPRDVFLGKAAKRLKDLPPGAVVGTSSVRRKAQILALRPDLVVRDLRGNVDTRLKKLAQGDADASYLAASGLDRLGIAAWDGLAFERVDLARMVPAAGQGAVALQCRAGESARFAAAGCARTTFSVTVERLFLAKLGEGCHTAFACHHAAGRVHLFRDDFGRRDVDFPAADLPSADVLADRILRDLRLRP